MTVSYQYWQAALAGLKPKAFVDDPQCGFYRRAIYTKEPNKAAKRTGWTPVAIFMNGGEMTAVVGIRGDAKAVTNQDQLNTLWSHIAANPISEHTYRSVSELGEPWPDSHETVASIPVANSSAVFEDKGTIVTNIPGAVVLTPAEAQAAQDGTIVWGVDHPQSGQPIGLQEMARRKKVLQDAGVSGADQLGQEIELLAEDHMARFTLIESDEHASKARSLQLKFLELKKEAVDAYEAGNRPLLDKQKVLREAWFPVRDAADGHAKTLSRAMGKWEDEKRKAAKVAAERAEAGQDNAASNVPPPATQIRGGSGRAASVTVEKVVTAIDVDKVFAQFKTAPQVIELLTVLAQKAIRSGIDVPGATVEERSNVR